MSRCEAYSIDSTVNSLRGDITRLEREVRSVAGEVDRIRYMEDRLIRIEEALSAILERLESAQSSKTDPRPPAAHVQEFRNDNQ